MIMFMMMTTIMTTTNEDDEHNYLCIAHGTMRFGQIPSWYFYYIPLPEYSLKFYKGFC